MPAQHVTEQDAMELVTEIEPLIRRHVDLMVHANRELARLRTPPRSLDDGGAESTATRYRASLESTFSVRMVSALKSAVDRVCNRVAITSSNGRAKKASPVDLRKTVEAEFIASEAMVAMVARVESGTW
jgi:hypothetical protein